MNIDYESLQREVEHAWVKRETLDPSTQGPTRDAVNMALGLLDQGKVRVAEKIDGEWVTNQWLKQAVLMSFRLTSNWCMPGNYFDKVPLKSTSWTFEQFLEAGFRSVPGSVVRRGAFVGKNVVLMPSFVNIGAYVDEGTMVDAWATVGSCAQIGKRVHLSGGVGIGGVLEPLQASPTIIEDDCFIGARSEVVEGVVVGQGSVLSMGVFLGQSTKIMMRDGTLLPCGKIPPYSVVVPGTLPKKDADYHSPSLHCAVIVKTVDEQTRAKTSINELLRD
jgi:2,3,4,5-tetrahydropyridine-2-carboxylate N-succinyltransferase